MTAMINDAVEVTQHHLNGTTVWQGVLRDVGTRYGERVAYVTRGQSTSRECVPMAWVRSLAGRTAAETRAELAAPVRVTASWSVGQTYERSFASLDEARAELAATKRALPASYVASQNDPLVTVGAKSWRAIGWSV